MAEKSIRIAEQRSGEYVATRDGYEQDESAEDRVIQLFEVAERHFSAATIVRGSVAPIAAADSRLFNSLPADLTDNLLTVGDKVTLAVMLEHTERTGRVWVTPIIYDASDALTAIRATKMSGMGDLKFYDDLGGGTARWWSPQLQWDVLGATKIGLHITKLYPADNTVVLKAVLF